VFLESCTSKLNFIILWFTIEWYKWFDDGFEMTTGTGIFCVFYIYFFYFTWEVVKNTSGRELGGWFYMFLINKFNKCGKNYIKFIIFNDINEKDMYSFIRIIINLINYD
jgi:hypothetical protein